MLSISRELAKKVSACHKAGYRVYPVPAGRSYTYYQLYIEKNKSDQFFPKDQIKLQSKEKLYPNDTLEWQEELYKLYLKIYNKHIAS